VLPFAGMALAARKRKLAVISRLVGPGKITPPGERQASARASPKRSVRLDVWDRREALDGLLYKPAGSTAKQAVPKK
jgi:hypothetical protein